MDIPIIKIAKIFKRGLEIQFENEFTIYYGSITVNLYIMIAKHKLPLNQLFERIYFNFLIV